MNIQKEKKIIFIGLILMSVVQIIQHYRSVPDYIYGSLIGVTVGIMLVGLIKSFKFKSSTTKAALQNRQYKG